MKTRGRFRLATRGSALARRQASLVKTSLEDRRYEVELETVETTGDQIRDELIHRLGKTGAFVRELDERVLDGEADGAIHSMKDMPTEQPHELVTAAVPQRGRPGDVLVSSEGTALEELPEGAVVGTSSLRRRAQLLSKRPDLEVEPLRGNVDTRLEKLLAPALQRELEERREADRERKGNGGNGSDESDDCDETDATEAGGDAAEDPRTIDDWIADLPDLERSALERDVETAFDAIVLAEAGLERSGLAERVEYQRLSTSEFVPAPGQGALAVTAIDGEAARTLREVIDHPRTRAETTAERIILAELGGGCIAPIGVYAIVQGECVHATVQVFDRDGEESVIASRDLPIGTYPEAAREFANDLAERGAAELIEGARDDADGDAGSPVADADADGGADAGPDADADGHVDTDERPEEG